MKNSFPFFLCAWTILAISAFISIFYGVEFTDTGYIEGAAYRIYSGQKIYQDFDYVRPPLTPWLWSFVFHFGRDGLEIFFRSLVVLQKLITAFFVYKTLKILKIDEIKSKISFLLTFGFLLNFIPSMPWHTTDGLFFLAISIMWFSSKKFNLAILYATLAALCKQSFYPAPFFVIFLLAIEDRKKIPFAMAIFLATTLLVLNYFGIQNFLKATSGSGTLRQLFAQGILPHIYPDIGFIIGIILFLFVLFIPSLKNIKIHGKIYFSAMLIPSFGVIYVIIRNLFFSDHVTYPPLWPGITHAFATTILILVALKIYQQGFNEFKKNNLLIGAYLFFAAWMSSLSWGPNNYLFSYGFLLASTILFFDKDILFDKNEKMIVIIISAIFLLIGRLYFPYRMDSPALVEYFTISNGHYKFIMASPRDIKKLNSIGKIGQTTGCKDTYPSVPQAGLIEHYIPALRADWKMDIEYPSRTSSSEKKLIEACTIFIERDPRILNWKGLYESSAIEKNRVNICTVGFDENFKILSKNTCELKN